MNFLQDSSKKNQEVRPLSGVFQRDMSVEREDVPVPVNLEEIGFVPGEEARGLREVLGVEVEMETPLDIPRLPKRLALWLGRPKCSARSCWRRARRSL
ncbi:unnamed protein product [Ilex paraguariensis]|uniref:Uncharacterized protein n=1 Tax=Ilex paraguariensis TaxID=185542 RepID=A0ABC8RIC7_9AQUA